MTKDTCGLCKDKEFNEETQAAIQEAEDMASGKIESKTYDSPEEFFKSLGI